MKTLLNNHALTIGLAAIFSMLIIVFGLILSGSLFCMIGRRSRILKETSGDWNWNWNWNCTISAHFCIIRLGCIVRWIIQHHDLNSRSWRFSAKLCAQSACSSLQMKFANTFETRGKQNFSPLKESNQNFTFSSFSYGFENSIEPNFHQLFSLGSNLLPKWMFKNSTRTYRI